MVARRTVPTLPLCGTDPTALIPRAEGRSDVNLTTNPDAPLGIPPTRYSTPLPTATTSPLAMNVSYRMVQSTPGERWPLEYPIYNEAPDPPSSGMAHMLFPPTSSYGSSLTNTRSANTESATPNWAISAAATPALSRAPVADPSLQELPSPWHLSSASYYDPRTQDEFPGNPPNRLLEHHLPGPTSRSPYVSSVAHCGAAQRIHGLCGM
jgi:hypothetical protein